LKAKKVNRQDDQYAGIKGDPKPERCLHFAVRLEKRGAQLPNALRRSLKVPRPRRSIQFKYWRRSSINSSSGRDLPDNLQESRVGLSPRLAHTDQRLNCVWL
jgi:hypothetical protein